MVRSNCCFLTCKQVSQEAGKVVWYFHLFKNFPQFVVIHTVKGFSVVKEAEVDVSLEVSCLLRHPINIDNLISGSSASLKPIVYIWNFFVQVLLRMLSITLLACEMSSIVWWFEHSFSLPFFGIGMKTDLLQSCGHWGVFQIC